jgi:hypothetical protein
MRPTLGLACALHALISVAVELLQVEMAVRIRQHRASARSAFQAGELQPGLKYGLYLFRIKHFAVHPYNRLGAGEANEPSTHRLQ